MSTHTTVTGNLTREPELRYSKEGLASLSFGVAVNRRWQDPRTHDWEEAVSFFDVVSWRELAENAAMTLSKGMRVTISGRLEQRSWENEAGERRSRVEIVASDIGPSLRYATAEVHRRERLDQGSSGDAASEERDAEEVSLDAAAAGA